MVVVLGEKDNLRCIKVEAKALENLTWRLYFDLYSPDGKLTISSLLFVAGGSG